MDEKYYLVIIQNDNTQAVYAYTSLDDALAVFHSELGYRGEGRFKTICTILNNIGHQMKSEVWIRKLEEVDEQD